MCVCMRGGGAERGRWAERRQMIGSPITETETVALVGERK